MAQRQEEALRKQKEAKQKKLLFVLAPVLLLLLVWQGPATLKAFTGGDAAPAPSPASTSATSTAPASTGSTPAPSSAPAPSSGSAGASAGAAAPGESLPDTDVPVEAQEGQLISFSRFIGKDPFQQQLSSDPGAGGAAPSFGAGATGAVPPPPTPRASSSPAPTAASPGQSAGGDRQPASAVIAVNGAAHTVTVGGTFPSGDLVFRLAAVADGRATIGLVKGTFSGGARTVEVSVGETVILVSRPDGLRYRVKLVRIG